MESKNYQIETIQDIINCTNEENLENFLTDFKAFLIVAHSLRDLAETEEIKMEDFIWIDDNKNKYEIILSIKS